MPEYAGKALLLNGAIGQARQIGLEPEPAAAVRRSEQHRRRPGRASDDRTGIRREIDRQRPGHLRRQVLREIAHFVGCVRVRHAQRNNVGGSVGGEARESDSGGCSSR